jgi:hypothetical protein
MFQFFNIFFNIYMPNRDVAQPIIRAFNVSKLKKLFKLNLKQVSDRLKNILLNLQTMHQELKPRLRPTSLTERMLEMLADLS